MNNYLCTQKQFHFENTIIYVHKNNSMNMKKKYFENTIIYVHKNNYILKILLFMYTKTIP